jgi:hypothetical protein
LLVHVNEGIAIFSTLMVYGFNSINFWSVIAIPSFIWINICLIWYNEHGINIFKKIILFHGLWYYCKMMWILLSL